MASFTHASPVSRLGLAAAPIVATAVLPFTAYFVLLSMRVISIRVKTDVYLGDRTTEGALDNEKPDPLYLATRAHGNFAENVPLALILATVAEVNGGSKKVIGFALAALWMLRVVHVELGLKGAKCLGGGRAIGYLATQGWLLSVAGYAGYLVKGFWGF